LSLSGTAAENGPGRSRFREARHPAANHARVENCWFCGGYAASSATAYRAVVYGNGERPPDAGGRTVERSGSGALVRVPIARCAGCASAQRRETAITLTGLALGVTLLPGAYAPALSAGGRPPFILFGSTTATLVSLAIIGFVAGLGAGVAVAARVVRGRARRDPRNHPEILALAAAGWSYDPPSID